MPVVASVELASAVIAVENAPVPTQSSVTVVSAAALEPAALQ